MPMDSELPNPTTELNLCPALVIQGPVGGQSLFNLVPLTVVESAEQLLRLAATPFQFFRFFGPNFSNGATYPLDLWFVTGEASIGPAPQLRFRPVVFWAEETESAKVVSHLVHSGALFVIVVSSNPKLRQAIQRQKLPAHTWSFVNVKGAKRGRLNSRTSELIWAGTLKKMCDLVRMSGGDPTKGGGVAAPDFRVHVSSEAQLIAARSGAITPAAADWTSVPVPWDFVAAPNAVLLNFARFRLPVWGDEHLQGKDAHHLALTHARQILASRGLTNFISKAADSMGPDASPEDGEFIKRMLSKAPPHVSAAVAEAFHPETPPQVRWAAFRSLYENPPLELAGLAPHQVILVCPSATARIEGAAETLAQQGAKVILNPQHETEPEYLQLALKAASKTGRRVDFPHVHNETQKQIAEQIAHTVRAETMHLSALALVHATRFLTPILKIDRCGTEVFAPFRKLHTAFEKGDAVDENLLASDFMQLASAGASLFPEGVLPFITERPDGLVHGFGDFPLEFVRASTDYLGYVTQLSRTPITPGYITIKNYTQTELTTHLPSKPQQFLLVTPFPDDEPCLQQVKHFTTQSGAAVNISVVRRRSELLNHLNNEEVDCLLYLGHGFYETETDEGGLILKDEIFKAKDLIGIKRVPSVVILVGCSTAPAVSISGGMHSAFLEAGTPLVVGTSFPVPKFIGAGFLSRFINHSIGPTKWRDLADIVSVVRRGMRADAEIYSLIRQKRISRQDAAKVASEYNSMGRHAKETQGFQDTFAPTRLLAEILFKRGVLANPDIPPVDWGTVPYPLFFSVLGFPWTLRNEGWI